jgi:hypothetical protein
MRTGTWLLSIAVKPTRAGIHRGDKLKVCTKRQRSFCAADDDDFIFHRLAHHFEDARAEFGKLVQEQDATVCEGDFAGLRDISATDQTGVRDRMVWRPEGTMPDQRCARRKLICHRIDACHVQGFFDAHLGQNAGQGAS